MGMEKKNFYFNNKVSEDIAYKKNIKEECLLQFSKDKCYIQEILDVTYLKVKGESFKLKSEMYKGFNERELFLLWKFKKDEFAAEILIKSCSEFLDFQIMNYKRKGIIEETIKELWYESIMKAKDTFKPELDVLFRTYVNKIFNYKALREIENFKKFKHEVYEFDDPFSFTSNQNIEKDFLYKEFSKKLIKYINTLDSIEKDIVFLVRINRKLTLKDIADKYQLKEKKVYNISASLSKNLRAFRKDFM